MCPESISRYLRDEKIDNCLFGINDCPIPVIVEYPDGYEDQIIKAYRVTGRTAAIKILINEKGDPNKFADDIAGLEDEISELNDKVDELKDCKQELEEWTALFDSGPKKTHNLWAQIENAIADFAGDAEIRLVANDAENIKALNQLYNSKTEELSEAGEIIAELRLDNRALCSTIEDQDQTIAKLEKLLEDQKQLDKPATS